MDEWQRMYSDDEFPIRQVFSVLVLALLGSVFHIKNYMYSRYYTFIFFLRMMTATQAPETG